jgi:hypothetical protein
MRPMPSHGGPPTPNRYPAATRIAAAARRGIPSDVPAGPPPGGISSPSPIQSVPQQNPYEPPTGESGWTRNAPSPFLNQSGPAQGGAWNQFNILQEGGRNAGAESGSSAFQPTPTPPLQEQAPPNFDEGPQYNWDPIRRYNEYLNSEPDRKDFRPGKWGTILNSVKAGIHGYQTGDVAQAHNFREALQDEPYQREVESWKRRGGGLARAAELEDKRYNIAGQDYNRRVDNARQQAELDLRKRTHMLNDEKFRYDMGKDAMDMMMKGWQPMLGPNGKIVMHRMGPQGPEQYETNNPNDKLTAAETRSEAKARDEAAMRRTRYSADSSAASSRAANVSRENVARENRAHDTSEGILDRAFGLQRADASRGVTGGADYTTPVKLLSSPSYREIEQAGLIKIINSQDGQSPPTISYKYENPAELEAELERLSGGNGAKYRELATRYRQFQDYMASLGGQ